MTAGSFVDIGCNAIRTVHNPQATDLYDLCDDLGVLVIDEAHDKWEYPKNKWVTGWNHEESGLLGSATHFREWGKRELQDYHPVDRILTLWYHEAEFHSEYPGDVSCRSLTPLRS